MGGSCLSTTDRSYSIISFFLQPSAMPCACAIALRSTTCMMFAMQGTLWRGSLCCWLP